MPLPADLQAVIDEDLARVRAELADLVPRARVVLAGSHAFGEPWAWRDAGGGWVVESDYDLYLLVPSLHAALTLPRSKALLGLGERLGCRAPVDPFVLYEPLVERGLLGMVGRDLDSGRFVDCDLDPYALRINQLRKALLRQHLLAPREPADRARYQHLKAAIEALRALILWRHPHISPRALFSLRANLRWLRAGPGDLQPDEREDLAALLTQRLDLGGPGPDDALLRRCGRWVEGFAAQHAGALVQDGPRPHAGPSTTTIRAWLSCLRHGLLPRPGARLDEALVQLLADPLTPRVAHEPALVPTLEARYRHLIVAPWPARPGALLRALDDALGNPTSGKGERYILPYSASR
jgi:predicted nucleotidyltransferase